MLYALIPLGIRLHEHMVIGKLENQYYSMTYDGILSTLNAKVDDAVSGEAARITIRDCPLPPPNHWMRKWDPEEKPKKKVKPKLVPKLNTKK